MSGTFGTPCRLSTAIRCLWRHVRGLRFIPVGRSARRTSGLGSLDRAARGSGIARVPPRRGEQFARVRPCLPRCGAFLVPLAAIGLAACIAIPIPYGNTVGQAVELDPADIGVMTREEVLARWGEPPLAVADNERVVAYTWVHEGWIWCVAVYKVGGDCGIVRTTHLTLIQFDELDRVRRVEGSSFAGTDVPLTQTVKEWANREAIHIGVTTREEIIARLGEANAIWESERVFEYNDFPDHQMLLIEFDESDRVARMERVHRPSGTSYGEFVSRWAKGEVHANP